MPGITADATAGGPLTDAARAALFTEVAALVTLKLDEAEREANLRQGAKTDIGSIDLMPQDDAQAAARPLPPK